MNNYYSLNDYLKNKYGEKIYKLALDAGFSCPNRDGTCGTGGCIFCTEGGSGDFAKNDLESAKQFIKNNAADSSGYKKTWKRKTKAVGSKFIAYYQSYSNTYAPVEQLREIYQPAIADDEIVCISIATRPDCLPEDVCNLLQEINEKKPVWVELGLQTIHEETASYINRGYPLQVFEDAVNKLRSRNIEVIVHLILGLPGETREEMLESIRYLNQMDIQGIKLHLLTILKDTPLGNLYEAADKKEKRLSLGGRNYEEMSLTEYSELVCDCIGTLREDIVVHRFTGDGPKSLLLSPLWTADKKNVLNTIHKALRDRNTTQGCLLRE